MAGTMSLNSKKLSHTARNNFSKQLHIARAWIEKYAAKNSSTKAAKILS